MKVRYEVFVAANDGETTMILEGGIPFAPSPGHIIWFGNGLELSVDENRVVWIPASQELEVHFIEKWPDDSLAWILRLFTECGFTEEASSRRMHAAKPNARGG